MKLLYKPFAIAFGVIGARLAGTLFEGLWKLVDRDRPAPDPTLRESTWGKVIAAAAIGGATQRVTQAVVERAGVTWFEAFTGAWAGKRAADEEAPE